MDVVRKLICADLYCGAGGTSSGLAKACEDLDVAVELLAINHWPRAIETHTKNHPWARHLCASIETVDPRKAVPGGRLDLLVASPECIWHSVARGGRPINDQRRSSAWRVLEWCERLYVKNILIENVPEFRGWGPLNVDGRPNRFRAGEIFNAFIAGLEAMNYRVEYRVLNAADYGAVTTRRRLFILARKGSRRIHWPEPTHAKDAPSTAGPFARLKPWRAAREIIDWTIPGESIFTRKRPLAASTLERIAAGLRKFGGKWAEPFLVILRMNNTAKSVQGPVPTITASGTHVGLCEPFIVPFFGEKKGQKPRTHDIKSPLPTVTNHGAGAIVEPFIITPGSGNLPKGKSARSPLPTVMTQDRFGVVSPFIARVDQTRSNSSGVRSTKKPLPTLTTAESFALVEPFIIQTLHGRKDKRSRSIGVPLSTITSADAWALVEPFILQQQSGGVPRSTRKPLPTIAGKGAQAIVTPFIVEASHKGGTDRRVHSPDGPLPTQPCSNRMGVVQPFILPQNVSNKPRSSKGPVPTITTTSRGIGVVQPYLIKYYSSGDGKEGHSIDKPIGTVTSRDRYALVIPGVGVFGLDIRFRMLNTRELARAMGFENYVFTGTRADQTKLIGNAVEVNQARALCRALLKS